MTRHDAGAAGLAIDSRGLDALRQRARDDPKGAAAGAAKQFEALLMQQLLKAMREATPQQDGPLSSDAQRTWTGLYDREIAEKIAGRGTGIASALQRQIERQIAARGGGSPATGSAPARPAVTPARAAAPPAGAAPGGLAGIVDSVRRFADEVRPHAEAAAKALGVSADWLVAHAGLETGWGRHQPRAADGAPSFNLFGIKAGTRWTGASVVASTREVVDGVARPVAAAFRAYASYADAFDDYAKLLSGPRYAGAVSNSANPRTFSHGLQHAGYATDPDYARKLERAIAMVGRYAPSAAQFPSAIADKSRAPVRGA